MFNAPSARILSAALVLFVTAGCSTRAQAGAPLRAVPFVSSLYLAPTASLQTRTFATHAQAQDCRAVTSAHPAYAKDGCTLAVTAVLKGRGASPIQTGRQFLHGSNVRTAYASIAICLSAPSLAHPGRCMHGVQRCIPAGSTTSRPDCYPSWNSQLSTQFQYNGRQIRRIWLDPCCLTGLGFIVRHAHAFSLPRSNAGGGQLPIGMDVLVTGALPVTRLVHSHYLVRMIVHPNGGVLFRVS